MMTKSEHTRYIRSPRWKARAAKYLRKHGRRCAACRRRDRIEVHHLSYDRAGRGKEPDRDLRALCRWCHQLAHRYENSGMYGDPYTGRTLRRATEAMMRDVRAKKVPQVRIQGEAWGTSCTHSSGRGWVHRQWLTLTGRKYQ